MSLLSKSEIQFLKGQKQVSKSYNYKLKSVLKKKISNLLENEIPLLLNVFPEVNLTKFSKIHDDSLNLTINSKKRRTVLVQRKFERCGGLEGSNHSPTAISAKANEKTHDLSHHDGSRNSAGRGIRTLEALTGHKLYSFLISRLAPFQARRPRLLIK